MKVKFFTFFLLIAYQLSAQINLVQNHSFENISGSINCAYGPTPSFPDFASHGQEHLEVYWAEEYPWTPPAIGLCPIGAGSADHFCDGGNTGQYYASMANREYICEPLLSNLEAGQRYYYEFYIKATSTLENAGIKFSTERPKQCGYLAINIDGEPQIEADNSLVFSYNFWTKVSGYYTPDVNYSWLTIGSFDLGHDASQTFAIDDIRIIKWVPDCPDIQLLENWDYAGYQGITISAGDKLYAGYDVGAPTANGNILVQSGSEISYKAGNEVGLFDGFSAVSGSEFHAYNAPCGSDCFPPSPNAGIATEICDGSSYTIGDSPGFETNYLWTSIPPNATSYLSSTTISDPVFTPPPTGDGTITFIVTAANSCGQLGSNSVTIHYDNNPSQTVQISLSNIVLGDIPSLDVNFDSHVKSIKVEVLDASLTNVYYSSTFLDAIDFTCCVFPWQLPVQLSPCMDYKIRVTATNYCTGATSSQIIDWVRNRNVALTAVLPNAVTPNGDGINDQFCFQFTGASSYTLIVNPPSGPPIYVASNVVAYPDLACSWSGECNQGLPTCNGDHVGDGVYFFTLTLFDCNNQPALFTSGFLELLYGTGRIIAPPDFSSETPSGVVNETNDLLIYPNPSTNGQVTIFYANNSLNSIQIYNSQSEIVASGNSQNGTQLTFSDLSKGVYFCRITTNDGKTFIKQLIIF